MSGYTHAAIGANAVWLAALTGVVDERVVVLVAAGALAGLLPDIDATSAKIHFLFGGVLSPFRGRHSGVFQHRGIFHSIFAVAVVFALSFIFLRQYNPLLPFVLALGYASHPFIDGLNTGVGYLFPFNLKRYALVPRSLQTRVGGPVDQLLFFLAIVGLLMFFLGHMEILLMPLSLSV